MIKDFETYIKEGRMSRVFYADENNVRKQDNITIEMVKSFVRHGHENDIKSISFRKENGEIIVDIDGDYILRCDIEKIPFKFGKVTGRFYCEGCENLTSLEGCPKEVGGFSCNFCHSLTSLEGCPEKVNVDFSCSYCKKLTSLEGCPKEVGRLFICEHCGKFFYKENILSLCNVNKQNIKS